MRLKRDDCFRVGYAGEYLIRDAGREILVNLDGDLPEREISAGEKLCLPELMESSYIGRISEADFERLQSRFQKDESLFALVA
jgi:hypothetical protein